MRRGTLDPGRRLSWAILIVVILALFSTGLNASASSACKRGCPVADRGIFRYRPGSVYTYNFDSTVTIALATHNADETSIRVQARANIYAEQNCGYTLKLDQVKVMGKGVTRKFTEGVDKPVQFTLSNGELEPQICADATDTDYSLNLKRAIVSMLQKSDKAHETDVFGVCPTGTSSTPNGKAELVTKVRNLNACMYRETLSNGFVSGLVNERAGVKSTPLLAAGYSQEQEINEGIIDRAELQEDYKFVPLANSKTGAGVRAKVRSTLKRTKTAQGAAPQISGGGVAKSIIFHNPRPVPVENALVLRTSLATTVTDMQDHVGPKTATQFTDVIRLMRNAGQQQLSTLYRDVRSGSVHPAKDLARKVYLDALFRTGTDDAVATIVKLIDTEMDEDEKRLAYLSFNLVDSVDDKTLDSINALLDKKPPKEAYLSIGHLVSKYCREHECDQDNTVRSIAGKFASKLGNCKAQTKKQEDNIVNILKGIGNAAILSSNAADNLIQCTASDKSARVRVAALQSLQRASCKPNAQQAALAILKNRDEDSEIRIEAYLTVVACPSAEIAAQIVDIVNSEPVYQVGGFIVSHQKSIRDSTDAYRESARQYFGNIRFKKHFPIDPRRYSYNREISYNMESLGVGGSADHSLIYSQKGFLPRSGRLNLTAEIFGNNFNLLEISARQENLELLMEHYFGPKGFFNERSHGANKQKRSVSRDNINAMAQKFKQFGQSADTSLLLDFSLKMFGNEMGFLSLGEHIPRDSEALAQQIATAFDEVTNKAKNFRHDCNSQSLFLSSELVYPTGMGFPLQMIAQGAGVGKIQMAANVNLKELSNWANEQYRFKLVPSVSVDVNAQMKIDARVLSTGLRVRASLHSSTGSDVTIKVTNGKEINIDFEMPFKKQEIVNFNHDVEFIVEDPTKETVAVPLGGRRSSVSDNKCFDWLSLFGLTVCGKISRPSTGHDASNFLLSGPTQLSLSLETEKKITLNLNNRQEGGVQSWTILYDTPGSQTPHNTEMKFELGTSQKWYGRLSFTHPEKKVAVEAGLQNDDKELALYGQYENDAEMSKARLGFKKIGPNEYEPLILFEGKDKVINNIAGYRATGRIIASDADGGKHLKFQNIQILDASNRATVLNGWIQYGAQQSGPRFKMDMTVRNPDNKDYTVKSDVVIQAGHYLLSGALLNGANPMASGSALWELQHSEGQVKNDIKIEYGANLKYGFELHNNVNYETDKTKARFFKFQNSLGSKDPAAKAHLNGQYSQNLLEYDLAANVGQASVASTLMLHRNMKLIGDYEADMTMRLNNHKADLKAKRTIQDGKSLIDNTLKTSWGTSASLKGKFSNRMTPSDGVVDLQGSLQLSDKDEPLGLIVKIDSTVKNAQANVKLTRAETELASFNGNYIRGDNVSGKFDLTVKDVLVGRGEGKWKGGVGDLSILVNLKKLARKIKLESKYNVAKPTYNVDTTLYYNFDKDNSKKIHFNTENNVQGGELVSKSALELGTERYSLDMGGKMAGNSMDGTTSGNFNLALPNGRQISGVCNRKSTTQEHATSGHATATLSDQQPDGKKRSLDVEARFNGVNPRARLFDLTYVIKYIDLDGRDGKMEIVAKHVPKDSANKMVDGGFKLSGALVDQPIDLTLRVDEYSREHAIYQMKANYGNKLSGNLNGNFRIGEPAKPSTYEIQMNLDAPNTEFKMFQIESHGSLVRPETEDGIYDGKINSNMQLGNSAVKVDGTIKGNAQHGSWSLKYDVPKAGPGKFEGSYTQDEKSDHGKYQLNAAYEYEPSKVIKMSADASYVNDKAANIHLTLHTPNDQVRNFEIIFKGDRSDTRANNVHMEVILNDKTYKMNSATILSDAINSVDITFEYPGKTSKIYGSFERLGERKGRGKLKIENFGDFDFDSTTEVSAQSFENFYLRSDFDSKKLSLDQVHIEAHSQPKSGGKGVEFKATAAGKNILSGSADYTVKHDKSKITVEGQGNVQLYEKPRSVNFRLVQQTFELGRDSEAGQSVAFNGFFGPKKFVAEFKMTNKNFIVKLQSCENKACSNVDIQSVTQSQNDETLQHTLKILVDLREMGWPHQLELESKMNNIGFRIEQELTMVVKAQNDVQYQLQTYIKQKESAILFTTPKRKIALESVYQIPEDVFGNYETSTSLYLNKDARPDEKSTIGLAGTLSHVGNTAVNMKGKVYFEHPRVKPLTISGYLDLNNERKLAEGSLEFDIFQKPGQKIVANTKYSYGDLSAKGMNITIDAVLKTADGKLQYAFDGHTAVSFDKYEMSSGGSLTTHLSDLRTAFFVSVSPRAFEIVTVAFNEPIFNAHGSMSSKQSELKAQFNMFGGKPVQFNARSQGFSSVSVDMDWRNLLKMEARVVAGKEAAVLVRGDNKDLFNARTALDPGHFLSTQYQVNEEDIKAFMTHMEEQTKNDGKQVRAMVEQRFNRMRDQLVKQGESFKDSLPDFSPVRDTYERNMNEIVDELSSDPTLHDIVEFYKRTFDAISRAFSTVIKALSENYQKMSEMLKDMYERMSKLFSEHILPIIQTTAEKISVIVQTWYNDVMKVVLGFLETIAKTLKTFEADFNRIGKAFADFGKQYSGAFSKAFETIQKEFEEIVQLFRQFIESLPGLDDIKAAVQKYFGNMQELREIARTLNDLLLHIEDFILNQEFKDFTRTLHDYFSKKISDTEKVDDIESLKSLWVSLVKAIRSLLVQFKSKDMSDTGMIPIPFTLDIFRQMPIWSNFKFSPFNYLRNEQWSSWRSMLAQPQPISITFPTPLQAHIADGENIFTFDGRHMNFAGSCSYVLVQDVDNHFAVVANLQGGKMKSVTLMDKSNTIELLPNAEVKLNGKAAEMPIHNKDMHAWRRYYSVFALSEYGAEVKCSLDLRVCHVEVSGYYTGKTRGILGNGNNEPYDDFTLPNGKITDNSADLGNSYAATGGCAPVSFQPHQHAIDPLCKELFDQNSNLILGYVFMDPSGYMELCNHAVEKAQDKKDAACNIALTYASAARANHIPVEMPHQCLKCARSGHELGDDFQSNTPAKKADIVFVVDTAIGSLMNDLVQNVMQDLRTTLRQRDMTDVHMAVVAYNEDMRYPVIFTTNGKLDFSGKLDRIDLSGAPTFGDRVKHGIRSLPNTYLDNWERLATQAVGTSDARAFNLAMEYPFRPDANRAIVAIRADNLQYANMLKVVGAAVSNGVAQWRGIGLHLIGPVSDFEVTGRSQQKSNVVGFDKRTAIMLGDAKKRVNFGSTEIRGQIQYKSDMGVDFVLEDDGYVFLLQNFEAVKDKPKERKQFTMAVAVALSDQLARTELIQECQCSLRHGLVAEEKCTVMDRNLLAQQAPKKPAARG